MPDARVKERGWVSDTRVRPSTATPPPPLVSSDQMYPLPSTKKTVEKRSMHRLTPNVQIVIGATTRAAAGGGGGGREATSASSKSPVAAARLQQQAAPTPSVRHDEIELSPLHHQSPLPSPHHSYQQYSSSSPPRRRFPQPRRSLSPGAVVSHSLDVELHASQLRLQEITQRLLNHKTTSSSLHCSTNSSSQQDGGSGRDAEGLGYRADARNYQDHDDDAVAERWAMPVVHVEFTNAYKPPNAAPHPSMTTTSQKRNTNMNETAEGERQTTDRFVKSVSPTSSFRDNEQRANQDDEVPLFQLKQRLRQTTSATHPPPQQQRSDAKKLHGSNNSKPLTLSSATTRKGNAPPSLSAQRTIDIAAYAHRVLTRKGASSSSQQRTQHQQPSRAKQQNDEQPEEVVESDEALADESFGDPTHQGASNTHLVRTPAQHGRRSWNGKLMSPSVPSEEEARAAEAVMLQQHGQGEEGRPSFPSSVPHTVPAGATVQTAAPPLPSSTSSSQTSPTLQRRQKDAETNVGGVDGGRPSQDEGRDSSLVGQQRKRGPEGEKVSSSTNAAAAVMAVGGGGACKEEEEEGERWGGWWVGSRLQPDGRILGRQSVSSAVARGTMMMVAVKPVSYDDNSQRRSLTALEQQSFFWSVPRTGENLE